MGALIPPDGGTVPNSEKRDFTFGVFKLQLASRIETLSLIQIYTRYVCLATVSTIQTQASVYVCSEQLGMNWPLEWNKLCVFESPCYSIVEMRNLTTGAKLRRRTAAAMQFVARTFQSDALSASNAARPNHRRLVRQLERLVRAHPSLESLDVNYLLCVSDFRVSPIQSTLPCHASYIYRQLQIA